MTNLLTNGQKLEAVRRWILTSCDIHASEDSYGQLSVSDRDGGYIPITLGICEVLRTLATLNQRVTCWPRGEQWQDFIIDIDNNNRSWKLSDDDLNAQSPELIDFLYSLIPSSK